MAEIPLVVINVQRGGPSTGQPTKVEQGDLLAAIFGSHGDAPKVVMAASDIEDCFYSMITARKIAETFNIRSSLLSDASLATAQQPFPRPQFSEDWLAPPLDQTPVAPEARPYDWDPVTGIAHRFIPGQPDGMHTLTGLAHDRDSKVAYDAEHQRGGPAPPQPEARRAAEDAEDAARLRRPRRRPAGRRLGQHEGRDRGGGRARCATKGSSVSSLHLRFIQPMPSGIREILQRFGQVMTVESNWSDRLEDELIDEDNRRYSALALMLRVALPRRRRLLERGARRSRSSPATSATSFARQAARTVAGMSDAASPSASSSCTRSTTTSRTTRAACRAGAAAAATTRSSPPCSGSAATRTSRPSARCSCPGIGCSSRFPHYMKTYGFHGIHGRAFPIAEGVKMARPDLDVFVNTGDGDCCSIGAAHWIHAIRYNMNLTVILHDNHVYGLTKKQASPTSPLGLKSNTTPRGAYLEALNPLTVTLGVQNVSFVAQAVDWIPELLYDIIAAAYRHRGFSFVRIIQRCPEFLPKMFEPWLHDPAKTLLLTHENGLQLAPELARIYKNQREHDPLDIDGAREIASSEDPIPVGILYRNPGGPVLRGPAAGRTGTAGRAHPRGPRSRARQVHDLARRRHAVHDVTMDETTESQRQHSVPPHRERRAGSWSPSTRSFGPRSWPATAISPPCATTSRSCSSRRSADGAFVRSLTSVVDDVLQEIAPRGIEGERMRRHVLRARARDPHARRSRARAAC